MHASQPYLRIQAITVPVRDLSRSVQFFGTTLGFTVVQTPIETVGYRVAFVSPPDGTAILVLSENDADHQPGRLTGIALITDDLDARYTEWLARGVRFTVPPAKLPWGARHAVFHDPDDNAFRLIESDIVSEQLEAERRAKIEREAGERRAAHEIAIATQVQAGLLPRQQPALATLDYAGVCVQARQVGGDYFDFLDYGSGKIGLVVGDVSGKGLGAALLMANLQAHVRGQFARYGDDLPRLLASINQLFLASAPAASYATLVLAAYDDRTRILRYVNCGHPPPLVLRRTGGVQPLDATNWVLGMFENWTGTAREVQLDDDDVVVLYTDGVVEATSDRGEEFGIDRLIATFANRSDARASELLAQAINGIQQFASAEQFDDITLVIARSLSARRETTNFPRDP